MTSNALRKLKALLRSTHQVAESFRGADMEIYQHLLDAADSIFQAEAKAEKRFKNSRNKTGNSQNLLGCEDSP